MFLFFLTLLVLLFTRYAPDEAGSYPEEKPPDFEHAEQPNYATAFYWEMYGAN